MSIPPGHAVGASLATSVALVSSLALAACGDDRKLPVLPQARSAALSLQLLFVGALESPVDDTIATFEAQSGLGVHAEFDAAGAVRDRIAAGAAVDVAIITPAAIAPLVDQQLVLGARVDLGRIGGGVAVRATSEAPAIATEDQFRQALLDADEIYYADPAKATAGAAFVQITRTLGIAEQVAAKSHLASGGKDAMQQLAASTAPRALGVTQISEIRSVPQVKLVGEYPGALQVKTTYAAIVVAATTRVDDARQLIQFFTGPEFQARLAQSGFEPVAP